MLATGQKVMALLDGLHDFLGWVPGVIEPDTTQVDAEVEAYGGKYGKYYHVRLNSPLKHNGVGITHIRLPEIALRVV